MIKILLTILFVALIGLLFFALYMYYSLYREMKDYQNELINKNKKRKDE
jgi:anionic cell wall polymer biosynthesis LytR-Cps2A-Psr (LCP) family protein